MGKDVQYGNNNDEEIKEIDEYNVIFFFNLADIERNTASFFSCCLFISLRILLPMCGLIE